MQAPVVNQIKSGNRLGVTTQDDLKFKDLRSLRAKLTRTGEAVNRRGSSIIGLQRLPPEVLPCLPLHQELLDGQYLVAILNRFVEWKTHPSPALSLWLCLHIPSRSASALD